MKVPKRLRSSSFLGLTALGVGLLVAALWIDDVQTLGLDRSLSDSLTRTLAQSRETSLVEAERRLLAPQAVQVDGRRGAWLEDLARAADQIPGGVLAPAPVHPRRSRRRLKPAAGPQALLQALGSTHAREWTSAVLTDKAGRVLAAWPLPQRASALGLSLARDPFFLALSDPNVGPGIVRHGYFPAQAKGAASAELVAACGIGDASGNFAGLLKVHAQARGVLLGPGAAPLAPLLSGTPGSAAVLALGDGRELYNSAGHPLAENLKTACRGCLGLPQSLTAAPDGSLEVDAAQGHSTLAVWQRVGSVAPGAAPSDVLSLVAFVPHGAPATAGAGSLERPKAFYERPLVLLLLVLALVLLLLALSLLWPVLDAETAAVPLLLPPAAPEEKPDSSDGLEQSLAPQAPAPAPVDEDAAAATALLEELMQGLREELALAQDALRESQEEHEKRSLAELELRTQSEAALKTQIDDARTALEASKAAAGSSAAEKLLAEARLKELERAQAELSKLEARLKAAEKQEGLRREQEAVRLAAVNTLSGELKTTLEVIKNYINTLLGGPVSDGQQEFLGVVINKSARLERLIGDLVEIGEIGSGMRPPRLESVSASSLVQDALVNARPQAENKNISLDFVENGAGQVLVDREKMGALLRGLLSHSVKVSPRNEKIALVLNERASSVELRISDAGMSLSPERAAKVFVQFHGVDSQAGPEFIGTGLRFTIFRSVVEAQGGSIALESQGGRGKTFIVTLPKASASAAAPVLPLPVASLAPVLPPLVAPPVLPPLPPLAAPVLPPPAPLPQAEAAPILPKVIHKPAPLDEALNAPWKRKEVTEDLGDWELPLDALPGDLKELPVVPQTVAADPLDFEKVFGAGAAPQAAPKVAAQPSDTDLLQFSAVFGAAKAPVAPPMPPPAPPVLAPAPPAPAKPAPLAPPPASLGGGLGADFDALFGPPAGSSPAPDKAPKPTSGGLNTLEDLNELLGQ